MMSRSQRVGGQGEAGAGAGAAGCVGAMAVGAGLGAGLGFCRTGADGLRAAGGGAAGCNSTKTGFGTMRGVAGSPSVAGSRPSDGITDLTGTVWGW